MHSKPTPLRVIYDIGEKDETTAIKIIMYADDLALEVDTSDRMKRILNRMYEYMDRNELKMNMNQGS